jgi:hypothetical protein
MVGYLKPQFGKATGHDLPNVHLPINAKNGSANAGILVPAHSILIAKKRDQTIANNFAITVSNFPKLKQLFVGNTETLFDHCSTGTHNLCIKSA